MAKITWFRNKVRDMRVQRTWLTGNIVQAIPERSYSITFWPTFYMWFERSHSKVINDNMDTCHCGLVFKFMYWSWDIFDYMYEAPYTEPWMEDKDRIRTGTLEEYMMVQKQKQ